MGSSCEVEGHRAREQEHERWEAFRTTAVRGEFPDASRVISSYSTSFNCLG